MNSKCVQNNRFVHHAKFSVTDYAKITLSKLNLKFGGGGLKTRQSLDKSKFMRKGSLVKYLHKQPTHGN